MSEEFSIDWPHGHITRDGRKARIICTDAGHCYYPIVALVRNEVGNEVASTHTKDGREHDGCVSDGDLVNLNAPAPAPAPDWEMIARDLWLLIYVVRAHLEGGAAEDASAYGTRIAVMNSMDRITRANLSQYADAFKCR